MRKFLDTPEEENVYIQVSNNKIISDNNEKKCFGRIYRNIFRSCSLFKKKYIILKLYVQARYVPDCSVLFLIAWIIFRLNMNNKLFFYKDIPNFTLAACW